MIYLVLDADYRSTGLRSESGIWLNSKTLNLPESLWNVIAKWVLSYQPIIQYSEYEKLINGEEINKLDSMGIAIKEEIEKCLPDSKVKYYSEGRLAYL